MIENHCNNITLTRRRLDSLSGLVPDYPRQYVGCDTSEVLCRTVACRFTLRYSMSGEIQTIAETFLLNPVDDRCLRRVRISR